MARKARSSYLVDRTWLLMARRAKGYSQTLVAEKCDITHSKYSNIERGVIDPSIEVGLKLADLFGVDVRKFINEQAIL